MRQNLTVRQVKKSFVDTRAHNFIKHAWRRWQNPQRHSRPVFLVGAGRSGTTMLVGKLNCSWRVELYSEDHPKAFHHWRIRELSRIEQIINESYAQVVLFKPILDTPMTPQFLEQFSQCRVLYTFRHYNDVINSSLKKFGINNRIDHVKEWLESDFCYFGSAQIPEVSKSFLKSRWKPRLSPESGAALHWLFYNRIYFDLLLHEDDRVKLICYETLVTDPEQHFRSICRFINIPFRPCMVEGVQKTSVRRDAAPRLDPQIRMDCEELWQKLLRHAG